jgi:transposase
VMDQEKSPRMASQDDRQATVGIDVAKEKVDVALRVSSGKVKTKVVANKAAGFEALRAWLAKHGVQRAHVCMEATGVYWEAIAQDLADHGFAVSVVNPKQIKSCGETLGVRSKTDQIDAKLIAEFCAKLNPPLWQPPSASVRRLRALVARRDALVELRTQESNRLEVTSVDSVRHSIEQTLAHVEHQIAQIEAQIRKDIDDDPTLKAQRDLLDTIPAVGEATIPRLLSHFGGTLRFASARQAVAYAGLDVRKHESGSSVRGKTRMSKKGHSDIRAGLYMPAIVAKNRTAWGKAFAKRLLAAGKEPMLVVGALMRKILVIAYGVLKSGMPFNPALHAS